MRLKGKKPTWVFEPATKVALDLAFRRLALERGLGLGCLWPLIRWVGLRNPSSELRGGGLIMDETKDTPLLIQRGSIYPGFHVKPWDFKTMSHLLGVPTKVYIYSWAPMKLPLEVQPSEICQRPLAHGR